MITKNDRPMSVEELLDEMYALNNRLDKMDMEKAELRAKVIPEDVQKALNDIDEEFKGQYDLVNSVLVFLPEETFTLLFQFCKPLWPMKRGFLKRRSRLLNRMALSFQMIN